MDSVLARVVISVMRICSDGGIAALQQMGDGGLATPSWTLGLLGVQDLDKSKTDQGETWRWHLI